jgi:WD40 repeat protein
VWNGRFLQFLAVGDVDGVIRVFFLATVGSADAQIHRIEITGDYPSSVSFVPDSTLLVVTTALAKTVSFYTVPSK